MRLGQLVAQYEAMNTDGVTLTYRMEEELVYTITFFQLMVSLIDDQCKVNSGKLIKKFPFETLVANIERAGRCWPLKRNLRALLNRLYYFEPEVETYMSFIIDK